MENGKVPSGKPLGTLLRAALILSVPLGVCVWITNSWGGIINQSIVKEVRAQKFVVTDDSGKERAEFGILPDGTARLAIWDKTRSVEAWLGVDELGSPLVAIGRAGRKATLVATHAIRDSE